MAIYDKAGNALNSVYSMNGVNAPSAYSYQGVKVFESPDYSQYTKENYCTVQVQSMQGFDVFSNVIFQFRTPTSSGNIMETINAATNTVIQDNIVAASDHGDSASFSTEYYDQTDQFPLLYVTADTNPAKVYINRVTTTTSQLVKTLSFPLDKAGYYAALALDAVNSIAYMVGYSEQNYQTDDGGANKTVISKWDLSNLTENQDGTFTPGFVSKLERPFIYVTQGQDYHDGMIWIASGGSSYNGYVYALDPDTGEILYTVDTETTVEVEGIAFISQNEMVVGFQNNGYVKYTFSVGS